MANVCVFERKRFSMCVNFCDGTRLNSLLVVATSVSLIRVWNRTGVWSSPVSKELFLHAAF